jgi:hypothetical protein
MQNHYSIYIDIDFDNVERHLTHNVSDILLSETCLCVSCSKLFKSFYCKFSNDRKTAKCPFCSAETILGSYTGYPIHDKDFALALFWLEEEPQ